MISLVERSVDGQNFVYTVIRLYAGVTEGIEMVSFYINDANSGMMQSANNEICSYDYCVLLCVHCT